MKIKFNGHDDLFDYSQLSKNPTDDAPDMVAMLAVHENPLSNGMAKAEAVANPLRGGYGSYGY